MLAAVIWLLIYILILGLIGYLIIWVLGVLGIPVPQRVIQIVGVIVVLLVILWFVQAVLGGGSFPVPRLG
jgi:hypothetical protein